MGNGGTVQQASAFEKKYSPAATRSPSESCPTLRLLVFFLLELFLLIRFSLEVAAISSTTILMADLFLPCCALAVQMLDRVDRTGQLKPAHCASQLADRKAIIMRVLLPMHGKSHTDSTHKHAPQ